MSIFFCKNLEKLKKLVSIKKILMRILNTEHIFMEVFIMERNKKRDNGGLYTAICCFAVVMAVIGFASTKTKKQQEAQNEIVKLEPQTEKLAEKKERKELPEVVPQEVVEVEPVAKEEVVEEIEFSRPVKGKVISEYSGEELLYNEALKDWRTHNGVDFDAMVGEQVKASANGVVDRVYDSNMGRSVVINHQNGFLTIYSNLAEDTPIKEGDEIAGGDVIGAVGNTALGDITEAPHLHFEIIKNGIKENPTEYIE